MQIDATVHLLPPERPSGVCWPPDDVCIVVSGVNCFDWLQALERLVDRVATHFENVRSATLGASLWRSPGVPARRRTVIGCKESLFLPPVTWIVGLISQESSPAGRPLLSC